MCVCGMAWLNANWLTIVITTIIGKKIIVRGGLAEDRAREHNISEKCGFFGFVSLPDGASECEPVVCLVRGWPLLAIRRQNQILSLSLSLDLVLFIVPL